MVAGLAGDTGKSLVALGVTRALTRRGLAVAPFKKGPDFIDAGWLGAAAGVPGRNLDTWLMPETAVLDGLRRVAADVAVVEGNRGLFDGLDAKGTHSTAQLARLLRAPVVLVVDATKVTRTVGALVRGCLEFEPRVALAGVILNRVGTARQEALIREVVTDAAGVPVLGAIPRLRSQHLPSRHLGLVTAVEHPDAEEALDNVADAVEAHTDLDALLDVARRAGPLPESETEPRPAEPAERRVRVGVLEDRAFSFYYPENLEALQAAGAELVEVSPLDDERLPDVDGLYAGGGFPEVHAEALSENAPFREDLRRRVADGLPVWAECGGLVYLSEALEHEGQTHPMVGALPVVVELKSRPQGHGYVAARVDADNPFLSPGTDVRGHEFHYSRLKAGGEALPTVLAVERGVGTTGGRDGLRVGRTVAAYTHLHASGTPEWAPGLVRAAAGEAA